MGHRLDGIQHPGPVFAAWSVAEPRPDDSVSTNTGAADSPSTCTDCQRGRAKTTVPVFWPGDPELWFAQVEAQFSTRRISDERTMYAHVVASLSKEYAAEVRDLLLHPPTTAPYGTLKAALIQCKILHV